MKWFAQPGFILAVVAVLVIAAGFTLAMFGKVDGGETMQLVAGAVFGGLVGFFGGLAQGKAAKVGGDK